MLRLRPDRQHVGAVPGVREGDMIRKTCIAILGALAIVTFLHWIIGHWISFDFYAYGGRIKVGVYLPAKNTAERQAALLAHLGGERALGVVERAVDDVGWLQTETFVMPHRYTVVHTDLLGVQWRRYVSASLPCWLVLALTAPLPIAAILRGPVRRHLRRRRNRCIHCGYDLTGLPEPRCPECGKAISDAR
ncbi:MAG: hypothetical protein GY778_30085 [bacterium]|nr:hypothetical protein [bacterium]